MVGRSFPYVTKQSMRHPQALLLLMALAGLSVIAGLSFGSMPMSAQQVWSGLSDAASPYAVVIRELRLPRVIAAFACGGLLALAGVLLQALLRNPLADPYLIGVSGGASVAALTALVWGAGAFFTGLASFAGALVATSLVYWISLRSAQLDRATVILSGVILAAGCGALITLMLVLVPQGQLRGMLFWLMGDVGYATAPWPTFAVLIVLTALAFSIARQTDILALGEIKAVSLGVGLKTLYAWLYVISALAAATAVTQCGTIGFIGLLIPHFLRLLGFREHRVLVPAAAVLGGAFLSLMDTLSRSIVAPLQLPVGAVTALIGVPLLLYVLLKPRRDGWLF